MNNITKEQLDALFLSSVENNLLNIKDQYIKAMNQLTEEERSNPIAREIMSISIAQRNVMAAIKDIFYELFQIANH